MFLVRGQDDESREVVSCNTQGLWSWRLINEESSLKILAEDKLGASALEAQWRQTLDKAKVD